MLTSEFYEYLSQSSFEWLGHSFRPVIGTLHKLKLYFHQVTTMIFLPTHTKPPLQKFQQSQASSVPKPFYNQIQLVVLLWMKFCVASSKTYS
jgi:hypothetical protein